MFLDKIPKFLNRVNYVQNDINDVLVKLVMSTEVTQDMVTDNIEAYLELAYKELYGPALPTGVLELEETKYLITPMNGLVEIDFNKITQIPVITHISTTQYNNFLLVANNALYTASGLGTSVGNYCTGRGPSGSVATVGLDMLRRLELPGRPAGSTIVDIGGNGVTLAYVLLDTGHLYTWGKNDRGVCGHGHTNAIITPLLVATEITKVFKQQNPVGRNVLLTMLLVQKTDGYVYGTGTNIVGQFGIGGFSDLNTLTKLPWIGQKPKFIGFCNGGRTKLVVQKADSTIWSIGDQTTGTLFDNVSQYGARQDPIDVTDNIGGADAGDIFYYNSTFFENSTVTRPFAIIGRRNLTTGRTVIYTVGQNLLGAIGDGGIAATSVPHKVIGMDNIRSISVPSPGKPTVAVITNDDVLLTWGYNGGGACGTGDTNDVLVPTAVLTGVKKFLLPDMATSLAATRTQIFVLKDDGVYGAGNGDGRVFNTSSFGDILTYTKRPHLSDLPTGIKFMGSFVTLSDIKTMVVVTHDNILRAWGNNADNGIHAQSNKNVTYPVTINVPG